ncbi:target of rapamycin complex subunit lst8-like isoform X2 [Limulus polyphemus]|uniref:Target of rapamycin complex subunit lst8 n=1 Tax=Limulus polyphemus TaxID=6850 RepID=A0ABM1RUG2_LIMPO|nr:target of rapamycin complex subunit lst8-like isoform X2 [Limulus polyphemus]
MGTDSATEQVILATGGYDHTIRFWQAHSGICQRTVQHADSVNALDITPDRQLLAAAGYQHVRMYDINSNNPSPVINYEGGQGATRNFTAVGFQEEGRFMFTGGDDCYAKIWDLRSKNVQCQRIFQANHPVNTVCLHPNQGELFIGDQNGLIHVWDLRTDHNEQLVADVDISIQHLHINSEGEYLAVVDNKGNCYIYSLHSENESRTSQPQRKLKLLAHKIYALKCKFSPDSQLLVTTSADSTAKIWRITELLGIKNQNETQQEWSNSVQSQTGKGWYTQEAMPLVELKEEGQRWVWDVAFSADSQYVLTAHSDSHARLWSVSTGEVKREYSGHQKALTALAFRDGS